jgi:tetraacyldisaccharide 4'-kinase
VKAKNGQPFEPGETPPPDWARPLLYAGSLAFGAGARLRGLAFDLGMLASTRVDVPVISVGNVSVGGSGKTPFTILLAQMLIELGHRPAVVSRGYGRKEGRKPPIVVSEGQGLLVDVQEAGDEPALIAHRCEARVVVDPDRVRGAQVAIRELGADVILLDDGFQHRRIARDLDIVLLDAERPFGSGHALPKGPLREAPDAVARAHLIVSTGELSGLMLPNDCAETPRVVIAVDALGFGHFAQALQPPTLLAGTKVAVLSAIARPHRFEATVRGLGADIVHRQAFEDHTWLSESDVHGFVRAAHNAGATHLLTTEKDAVRMPMPDEIQVLSIGHRVVRGQDVL